MSANINLQIATQMTGYLPTEEQLQQWIEASLTEPYEDNEITVRIVDEQESAHLNRTFRDKDYATNVLSFTFSAPEGYENILGDMILCAPIIAMEAEDLNKPLQDHWAHLVVHGTLHLQGYDHLLEEDEKEMQELEINILSKFGVPNPYQS